MQTTRTLTLKICPSEEKVTCISSFKLSSNNHDLYYSVPILLNLLLFRSKSKWSHARRT